MKHGEELICSYFACRNAGIKFRYCSHCKVPVAKRNFRKRHKHGGEDVPPLQGDADDSGGEDEVSGKRDIPSQITAKRSNSDADGLSSNSAESNDKEDMPQGLVQSSTVTHEPNRAAPAAAAAVAAMQQYHENPKISRERMERWASLLGRRPATKEGDMMSAWLMDVLAVSDLDTPLKSPEELDSTPQAESNARPAAAAAAAAMTTNVAVAAPTVRSMAVSPSKDSKKPAKESSFPGASSVVKKKRATDLLQGNMAASSGGGGTETYASGSFAAWKERKKQKKQAKMTSPDADA